MMSPDPRRPLAHLHATRDWSVPLLLIIFVPLLIVAAVSQLAPRSASDSNSWVHHIIWIEILFGGFFAILTGYLLFRQSARVETLVTFAPRPKARAILGGLYGVGNVFMAVLQLFPLVNASTIMLLYCVVLPFVVALVWIVWRLVNSQA